jgi:hypothetical protein
MFLGDFLKEIGLGKKQSRKNKSRIRGDGEKSDNGNYRKQQKQLSQEPSEKTY